MFGTRVCLCVSGVRTRCMHSRTCGWLGNRTTTNDDPQLSSGLVDIRQLGHDSPGPTTAQPRERFSEHSGVTILTRFDEQTVVKVRGAVPARLGVQHLHTMHASQVKRFSKDAQWNGMETHAASSGCFSCCCRRHEQLTQSRRRLCHPWADRCCPPTEMTWVTLGESPVEYVSNASHWDC